MHRASKQRLGLRYLGSFNSFRSSIQHHHHHRRLVLSSSISISFTPPIYEQISCLCYSWLLLCLFKCILCFLLHLQWFRIFSIVKVVVMFLFGSSSWATSIGLHFIPDLQCAMMNQSVSQCSFLPSCIERVNNG